MRETSTFIIIRLNAPRKLIPAVAIRNAAAAFRRASAPSIATNFPVEPMLISVR